MSEITLYYCTYLHYFTFAEPPKNSVDWAKLTLNIEHDYIEVVASFAIDYSVYGNKIVCGSTCGFTGAGYARVLKNWPKTSCITANFHPDFIDDDKFLNIDDRMTVQIHQLKIKKPSGYNDGYYRMIVGVKYKDFNRCHLFKEELMRKVYHPSRIDFDNEDL